MVGHRKVLRKIALLAVAALLTAEGSCRAEDAVPSFRDVAVERGLEFTHHSPFTPQRHLHLTMGSGVAWLDFDRDGRPDLYLAQGCEWTGSRTPRPDAPYDRLYRNLGGHFREVALSGIENRAYAMGLASGDFDNDGFPDLYVSNFGPNLLLHNNGDGTCSIVSNQSCLADNGYGASCTWIDIEPDGDLDLFVTNYLEIDDRNYRVCQETGPNGPVPLGCQPWKYPGAQDRLFVNGGAGNFHDGTDAAGMILPRPRRGLGVVAGDFNEDGLTDLFVANDSDENELWVNVGQGRFEDQALLSGIAVNREGKREAGMGVAAADVDGDGLFDLFLTHYQEETNTLYRSLGRGQFLDVTNEFGLAAPSRTRLAFGTILKDFNADGDPDCFVANGHIHDLLDKLDRNIPYAQEPQLFVNRSGRRFENLSDRCGDYFRSRRVGRGAAAADFDGDGRLDLAIQHCNGPVALLRNETSHRRTHHLRPVPVGTMSARDPAGASLIIQTDHRRQVLLYEGSSSYLSCNERSPIVSLDEGEQLESICVVRPGGIRECWTRPVVQDHWVFLIEGTGSVVRE